MDDYYCQQILERLGEIAQHMYSVGPGKMSRRRLIQVLATLNPWELQSPDIGGAVKVRGQFRKGGGLVQCGRGVQLGGRNKGKCNEGVGCNEEGAIRGVQ